METMKTMKTTEAVKTMKTTETMETVKTMGIVKKVKTSLVMAAITVMMTLALVGCQGKKAVTIEVVDQTGVSTVYEVKTDEEFLYDAIMNDSEINLEGEEGDYGFYIIAVNGVTADYNVDASYWSLYVNGNYGQVGISEQIVNDGDSFALKYECAE